MNAMKENFLLDPVAILGVQTDRILEDRRGTLNSANAREGKAGDLALRDPDKSAFSKFSRKKTSC